MIINMLGTIINTISILVGGILGLFVGKLFNERMQETLLIACGIATMFIGLSGALKIMLSIEGEVLNSGRGLLVILCLALGAMLGEIVNLDKKFVDFGVYLKNKTGNQKDKNFVNGFITTSFTVCIGAMAIIGALKDGMFNDSSILITKSVLDFILVMIMSSFLGKGCIFSFIPVFIFQGAISLVSSLLGPYVINEALVNIDLIGSILIFSVGINLVFDKKIRVANLLLSLIFAIIFAYLPFKI